MKFNVTDNVIFVYCPVEKCNVRLKNCEYCVHEFKCEIKMKSEEEIYDELLEQLK